MYNREDLGISISAVGVFSRSRSLILELLCSCKFCLFFSFTVHYFCIEISTFNAGTSIQKNYFGQFFLSFIFLGFRNRCQLVFYVRRLLSKRDSKSLYCFICIKFRGQMLIYTIQKATSATNISDVVFSVLWLRWLYEVWTQFLRNEKKCVPSGKKED